MSSSLAKDFDTQKTFPCIFLFLALFTYQTLSAKCYFSILFFCSPTDTDTKQRFTMLDVVLFMCLFIKTSFSIEADTISGDDVLSGNSIIVSAKGLFQMGFFQPGPSPNYYIGIWYRIDPSRRTVWVANRDKPVSSSSELRILNGNLVLLDKSETPIWSTNVSATAHSVQAVLLDSGNLILCDGSDSSNYLWQSFDHPTHAWLPGAKLRYNKRTRRSQALTSWKNLEDPAQGLFSYELDPSNNSTNSFWNKSRIYWTSGSWNGHSHSLMPNMRFDYAYLLSFESNENESYYTYTLAKISDTAVHFEMHVTGQIGEASWLPNTNEWDFCPLPQKQCMVYALCGPYGSCSEESSKICLCLPGFVPKLQRDWDLKDYSGGCMRMTKLSCGSNNTRPNGKRDRFLKVPYMSLPENKQPVEASNLAECESKCLNDCSCAAYVYDYVGCSVWIGDLINLKQLGAGDSGGMTLNIRVAASEYQRLKGRSQKWKLYVSALGVIAAAAFTFYAAFFVYYLKRKRTANKRGNESLITDSLLLSEFGEVENSDIHVPFVGLERILDATNSFSEANKLGHGGFGHVYKGSFLGGQQIAIKRLSRDSGQGLSEFKNEVLLISKLQHRNLVRLLGYCVDGDERILVYEYMPNKSLDSFLFDQKLCTLLTCEIRLNIILGIARGLLYLHHDSRLRIIHRDLKTSNVLLDEEMNPKISDFGLARSFGGKQLEAKTTRVVGTYGYMSPEYALKGLFSIKSDVFAFGVVILEIISGKRSTRSCLTNDDLSLLEYAWKLWTEKKELDLMDPTFRGTFNENEFMRCLVVGLLCVQEDPNDRPNMSNVVAMLVNESGSLARPNQPAFVLRTSLSSRASSDNRQLSNNELTNSLNQGR